FVGGVLWVFLMNKGKEAGSMDKRGMVDLKGWMVEELMWLWKEGGGLEEMVIEMEERVGGIEDIYVKLGLKNLEDFL
ncbi:hypothetical protein, partial [Bacillus altitudinis]|uniref:hypothetical protein n=1 Tax=Bacillus altitudinis TaxID=293387 RepID=UPI001C92DA59